MQFLNENGSVRDRKARQLIFLAGLAAGAACFVYYYAHGLTTAHYDAKAHLLVARRLVDSLEPGYSQMGVHWLPLIHLIYLPFVIFDSQYQSGFLPSLISVFSFAVSVFLAYRISLRFTGSQAAGAFAAIALLANPNLEYLQSCPLTEPVYMMLFLLAVDSLVAWRAGGGSGLPWMPAVWASLGAFCRYEGWYFLAGVMLLLAIDYVTQPLSRQRIEKAGAVYLGVFALPAIAHFGYILWRLGDNFFLRVAEGNPSPYMTYKRPFLSALYHLGEVSQMAAILPLLAAAAGLLLFAVQRREWKTRAPLLLLWIPSLINISALYWGLIYRLRYSVLLLPAVAIFGSLVLTSDVARKRTMLLLALAAMALPWISWYVPQINPRERLAPGPGFLLVPAAALLLYMIARSRNWYQWPLLVLCVLGAQVPPLERENRPMMVETLEHEFIEPERRAVMEYLRENYDGKKILIDMGRQAPLVYDSGLPVKEFIYNEGRGVFWHAALRNPAESVGWLFAETGDAVSERLRIDPGLTQSYSLALKTDYFSLYHRKKQ